MSAVSFTSDEQQSGHFSY